MPIYRCYANAPADGHYCVCEREFEDDSKALAWSARHCAVAGRRTVALWQGERLVHATMPVTRERQPRREAVPDHF